MLIINEKIMEYYGHLLYFLFWELLNISDVFEAFEDLKITYPD
jgi:hypothetical protein